MLIARHADRLSGLVDHVVDTLAEPLADPLQSEWIAVPARGTQVWLTEHLSGRVGCSPGSDDGVLANVTFGFPGTLASTVLAETQPGQIDPWSLDHLVFTVMGLLQEGVGDPQLGPLAEPVSYGTRYRQARGVADLFDRYNVRRPDMIRQWAAGNLVDPMGRPLGARAWQAELWGRVHQRIGEPSASERLPGILRDLRSGDLNLDLPPRLTLFGLSVVPERLLQLAAALSVHRDVHLLTLTPSPALLEAVQSVPVGGVLPARSEDPSLAVAMHPLVASWGRPMREAAVMFTAADIGAPGPPVGDPSISQPTRLLGEIQAQIRENRPAATGFELAEDDDSLTVHSCHGPGRQVEVLYDLLLHALEANPDWIEDDIAVLVTDVEAYAPIIEAVFGASADTPGANRSKLRYRITDQSLRATNPYATAALAIVDLITRDRFEASHIADLLALPPVRHRFGFDDDDIRAVTEWMQDTNVRWGLNDDSRRAWGIEPVAGNASPPNSWRSMIDQLLLGAAVADSRHTLALGNVPTVPVEGNSTTLAGHLADVVGHLEQAAQDARIPRPMAQWRERLTDLFAELLSVPMGEDWQTEQLDGVLADIAGAAEVGSGSEGPVQLAFADVADVIAEHLGGRSRRASFRPGTITITSLAALRSVPHRLVCIVGLDESAFGASVVDGDDLAQVPLRVGDPDARNDSRQVLLEALMSAADQVIITRTGHDIIRNHEVPEAVPLSELWDAIAATVGGSSANSDIRQQLEFRHTRHGFDRENFLLPGEEVPTGSNIVRLPHQPLAHNPHLLRGAQMRASRPAIASRPPVVTLDAPIEREPSVSVLMADLRRLLRSPVQFFLQSGLQVRLPYREDPFIDRLPVEADALDGWRAANSLMAARSAGVDDLSFVHGEQTRGSLAQGDLATRNLEKIEEYVDEFLNDVEASGGRDGWMTEPITVEIDGRLVSGTIDSLRQDTHQLARFEYKRPKAHHRLLLWLDLALVTMAQREVRWEATLVTRSGGRSSNLPTVTRMFMKGESEAERHSAARTAVRQILDLHDRALAEPLPLMPSTSWLMRGSGSHAFPESKIAETWGKDTEDDYVALAFGGRSWREMQAEPPRADEPAPRQPAQFRAESWSGWLWEAVADSVRVEEGHPVDLREAADG